MRHLALATLSLAGALGAQGALAQPVRKDPTPNAPPGAPAMASTTIAMPMLDSAAMEAFRWRPIGPTNMGGRVAEPRMNTDGHGCLLSVLSGLIHRLRR